MDHETLTTTWQLVTTGWLTAWPALALFLGVGLLVGWQLHRELRAVKGIPRLKLVLVLCRVLVVGLATWLLAQPLLVVTSHWTVPPVVLSLVPRHASMKVREDCGAPYRKLDVLEQFQEVSFPTRNRAASELSRSCTRLAAAVTVARGPLQAETDRLATGLPPSPEFAPTLERLAAALTVARQALVVSQGRLPQGVGNDQLKETQQAFTGRLQRLLAELQELAARGPLVRQETAAHPDVLEGFVTRVIALGEIAAALATDAGTLQTALDEALLPAAELQAVRDRVLTRTDLAGMAVAQLRPAAPGAWRREPAASLAGALEARLQLPVREVIVFTDGSGGLTAPDREVATTLAETGVHVHACLVGPDGQEPADAGVMAAEVPALALVGDKTLIRALVKARVPPAQKPRLVIQSGEKVVAETAITQAETVIELPVQLSQVGRQQLVIKVETATPDAFPGNERYVATVDVLAQRPRVLIVSDALRRDFALWRGVAEALPLLRVEPLLAAPGMTLTLGGNAGEFPAQAEQWAGVSLVVLLGGVPEGITPEAVAALRTAIGNGLHVLVQPAGAAPSWATALGLESRPAPALRLALRPDLWLGFYSLGRDAPDSLARWARLPEVTTATAPVPAGLPLVAGGDQAPLQALVQGRGLVLWSGVNSWSALRRDGNAENVNRLVAGLLELGVQPWREGAAGPLVLPPQPVWGRCLLVSGEATPGDGAKLEETGAWTRLRVTDPQAVAFVTAGTTIRRDVHQLLGPEEFALAARAEPLRELARLGGGRYLELDELPQWAHDLTPPPAPRSLTRTYRLWAGWWPLAAMVLVVSAEYLLRRRAGRVM